jgi:hypothetical protein
MAHTHQDPCVSQKISAKHNRCAGTHEKMFILSSFFGFWFFSKRVQLVTCLYPRARQRFLSHAKFVFLHTCIIDHALVLLSFQEFEFNIVAPGGAECARVLQTIFTKDSTAAQKFRLGKVVVSIEKWLGPERANGEVDVEEELKVLTEIATLSTEPAESSVGEWRSFNRLAIPASHIADKEDARDEGTGRFNFECEETSQRARILRKEDGDDILDAQHISLPGGITTGVVVSGNNLVISAGWSTARGVCKVVEREYERDGATALVEVRDSSRVFDRWVGGEM